MLKQTVSRLVPIVSRFPATIQPFSRRYSSAMASIVLTKDAAPRKLLRSDWVPISPLFFR